MWRKRGSCPAGGGGCVKYRRPKELNADLIWSEAVSEEDEIFITVVMLVSVFTARKPDWRTKTQKSAETLQILFTIKQKKSFPIIYFSCWHQTRISCWTQNNLRFRSFGYDGTSRWRVKVCSHQAAALCISLTLCPLRCFVMFTKYRSLINNKQLLEVPIHACKPVHQTGTQNDFLRRVFELSASFLLVMCRDGQ